MSEKIRIHVHQHMDGHYGSIFAGCLSEIELWTMGYSRKPLYAINYTEKERADGDRHQEER